MLYETIFGFCALFILTKILGKTQISQLTAFDFIAALVLGELVGNALFDEKAGILEIAYIIFLWGSLLYIVEFVTQKFKGSRYFLEGKPAMIIHKGKLVYEELRKNKVDIDEIQHLLRMKDVFSIQEVEYAILETNGELSVLKKPAYQTPNKQDLNVKLENAEIAIPLIQDGEFVKDNLAEANVSENKVKKELERLNIDSIKEVFYAEWQKSKGLFALTYEKIKHKDYLKKFN